MANTIQKESKIIYLQIGQNYENLGVQKQFDVSEWTAEFPDAHIYLLFKRPGEEAAAPVNTTLDEDGILTWTVSNWETGIIGIGFAEIRAIDSSTGLVKKSHVIPCSIEASVTDEDAAPDYPSWVDRMLQFGENVDSIYATLPHELEEGIASIQQEAQEQTEAIEQKGITTRASIPADYTTLSDEVTDLKSAFDELVYHDGNSQSMWQVGGLGSKGENTTRATSIRTIGRVPIDGYYSIVTTAEYTSGYLCVFEGTTGNALHRYSITGGKEYTKAALLAAYPTTAYFRIEIAGCDGDVTAYNQVKLILADALGDAVDMLTEADNNLDNKLDAVNALVNYDYDESANYAAKSSASASSSERIGIKRDKTIVVLSGGDVSALVRIKLNGTVARTATSATVESWSGIQLEENEKYRVVMQLISGSSTVFESIGVSIYREGESSAIGVSKRNGNRYILEFTAPSVPVNVAIYILSGIVFSNEKVCIFMEKVEESNLTSYIEQGTKNINQFATQWQPNGLGSNGENTTRATSIRTTQFWQLDNILSISVTGTVYLCLYTSNDTSSFLARYSYADTTIGYDEIIAKQPTAKYFRIELLGVAGAISAYDNITIIGKKYAYGLDAQDEAYNKAVIFGQQRTTKEQYGDCVFRAMIVSDVHAEYNIFGNTIALMHKWGLDLFDAFINCGDTVRALQSDGIEWHNNMLPFIGVPYVNVVGNHDACASLSVLTEKSSTYQTVIAPIASQQGIVQPTGAQSNSLCYYYFDINNKVRIIALDCMYWDSTEAQWLEDTLASANTADLSVICVSHYGFGSQDAVAMPSLWREVSGFPSDNINITAAEKVSAFINNGGTFVCWLVGHSHGDNLYKLSSTYNDQLVITFPSLAQRAGTLLKNTDADAYNYMCATYMALDDYSHTVRFMRIGANIDTWGVQHTGLVLDYANRTLITAW